MGMAKDRLNVERSLHLTSAIKGGILAGIGIFGGIMVLRNGIGTTSGRGLGGLLYKGMSKLMEQGGMVAKLVPIGLSCVFFCIALYALFMLLRSLRAMSAKHSCLGKSIMTQAEPGETLRDLIKEIDDDMEREHVSHGPIHIGRQWIFAAEAMRISRITGIFTIDAGSEGVALSLMDKDGNQQHIGFDKSKGERVEDAALSLHAVCPNSKMGGNDDYLDMTEPGWRERNAEDAPEEVVEIAAGQLVTKGGLRLNRKDGIPSSNFVWGDVSVLLKELEVDEELSITLLEPTKPSKYMETEALIVRRKGDRDWEIAVSYSDFDDPFESIKAGDYYGASDAMRALVEEKTLPDFSTWEQRSLKVKKQKVRK